MGKGLELCFHGNGESQGNSQFPKQAAHLRVLAGGLPPTFFPWAKDILRRGSYSSFSLGDILGSQVMDFTEQAKQSFHHSSFVPVFGPRICRNGVINLPITLAKKIQIICNGPQGLHDLVSGYLSIFISYTLIMNPSQSGLVS